MKSFALYCNLLVSMILPLGTSAQILADHFMDSWKSSGIQDTQTSTNEINLTNFGLVADGTTSNNAALETAIQSISNQMTVLRFPAGTFFFDQPIHLPSHIVLKGQSAQETNLVFNLNGNSHHAIQISGTQTSTSAQVQQDIPIGTTALLVDHPERFQVGNLVKLGCSDEHLVTSDWALNSTGQMVLIKGIQGNTLELGTPIRRSYLQADAPAVTLINPAEQVGIECLSISRQDQTEAQTSHINFDYAINCWVRGIECAQANFAFIDIRNSCNVTVAGSYFHHAFDYGEGGKAYGVVLEFNSGQCLIQNNIFDNLRHSMLLQAGANGNVVAYNYSTNPYWTETNGPSDSAGDLVLHGNFVYANLFEGNIVQNIVIDDSHGANGPGNTFFRNRAELYGIFMSNNPPSDNQNFIGNEVTNTSSFLLGLYNLNGSGHFEYGNNVKGAIVPANTFQLNDQSYFLEEVPSFYESGTWPPIGLPNFLGSVNTEAARRFNSGEMTDCNANVLTDLEDVILADNIKLYPNPTKGLTKLEVPELSSLQNIRLFDSLGRFLFQTQHTELDLTSLESGLYFIQIELNEQAVITKKLLKE